MFTVGAFQLPLIDVNPPEIRKNINTDPIPPFDKTRSYRHQVSGLIDTAKKEKKIFSDMDEHYIGIWERHLTYHVSYEADYKIHMMAKPEYIPIILDRILTYMDRCPASINMKILRRIEQFYIFPEQIEVDLRASIESLAQQENSVGTYQLDGEPMSGEILFMPQIVFYALEKDVSFLISFLLELFPDDLVIEWTYPHYFPRFNIRINPILFIGEGGSDERHAAFDKKCKKESGSARDVVTCTKTDAFSMPREYEQIQEQCASKSKSDCNSVNAYSRTFSGHDLCQWKDVCRPTDTYSKHLLFKKHGTSLKEYFEQIGQTRQYQLLSRTGRRARARTSLRKKSHRRQF